MKFKIEDINNLSDSRQIMESKPNKLIVIFFYILLLFILTFFTWAWFSEKEIVVKISGIVRPKNEIQAISNIVQGKVKIVNMKNGANVSKGDILFEIDSDTLEQEKKHLDDQIKKINKNNQQKEELENDKKQIEKSIEKCIIKAPSDGKLNIILDLHPGLILQPGSVIANIIPSSNNYKIDLTIPTKDVANIKEGQDVKYSFEALPYREYGFSNGKLEVISPDSNLDSKTGIYFFKGESSLNSYKLYNNKGEENFIRPGMLCEAKITTRSEKILYYILEKIGFKNT